MKKRCRRKMPDFSITIPLDPEEFLAAHQYAGMVMENEFLEEVPAIGKAMIRTSDGTFGFTNHPFNLFGFAVKRYFRDQPDKFISFMRRFFALGPLMDHDEIKPYLKGTGDDREMHLAVFEVAATEKLSDGWEFEPRSFFRKVRETAARMERDELGNN